MAEERRIRSQVVALRRALRACVRYDTTMKLQRKLTQLQDELREHRSRHPYL